MANNVGWGLAKRLLPTAFGATGTTAKPRLREGGANDRPPVTYRELWENEAAVVLLAVELAASSVTRWLDLVPLMSCFPPAERDAALRKLDDTMRQATSIDRKLLWTALRTEIARHDRFSSAQWTLKG